MTSVASTPAVPQSRGATVLVAGAAALGGFLFGYDTAVINGTVDAVRTAFGLQAGVLGLVVSAALLGCAAGAWFAGPLADRLGRVRVMLIAAVLFAVSAAGSGLAVGAWSLALWRVVGGVAVGAASVIAPAYIAEISPADLRGRLGSLQQLAIVAGIFASLLVDYALAACAGGADHAVWGGAAWRWMFASAAAPALVYGVVAVQIPESPRYLVRKQDLGEARRVLARFVGGDVDQRIAEISRSLGKGAGVKLADLRGPRLGLRPVVWVGILLSVFQQFVGINVIFYYSTTLWRAVGFTEKDAMATSVVTSITNILTTLIAIALIDRIGRKPLLLIGAAGMAVTLALMAGAFTTAWGTGASLALDPGAARLALVAANVYVFAFGMSWGPVVWVLLGEMFDNRIRATALAVAAAAQWIANFIVSTTFPVLAGVGLSFAYSLYAASAALAFFFVWRSVTETTGRELEDM
jgi:sugar porter (SP) family MFS transporter